MKRLMAGFILLLSPNHFANPASASRPKFPGNDPQWRLFAPHKNAEGDASDVSWGINSVNAVLPFPGEDFKLGSKGWFKRTVQRGHALPFTFITCRAEAKGAEATQTETRPMSVWGIT